MNKEKLYSTILGPHISEKGTTVAEKNKQIVFKVQKNATKEEVKKSVEHLFEVEVDSVNVLNLKGKQKRFGRTTGQQKGYKKAYVKLKPDQDLDFSELQA